VVAAIGAVNLSSARPQHIFIFARAAPPSPQFFLFGAQPEGAENGSISFVNEIQVTKLFG